MNVLFFLKPKATVAYVYCDNTLRQALEKMRFYGYSAIPVLDREGKYIGTVTEGDFLWKLSDASAWDNHAQERLYVRDILRTDHNPSVNVNASIEDLLLMAMNQNFVPVMDDTGTFIGIVTRRDIMQYYFKVSHGDGTQPSSLKPVDQSFIRQ